MYTCVCVFASLYVCKYVCDFLSTCFTSGIRSFMIRSCCLIWLAAGSPGPVVLFTAAYASSDILFKSFHLRTLSTRRFSPFVRLSNVRRRSALISNCSPSSSRRISCSSSSPRDFPKVFMSLWNLSLYATPVLHLPREFSSLICFFPYTCSFSFFHAFFPSFHLVKFCLKILVFLHIFVRFSFHGC